jgi:hypothetical protein
MGKIKTLKQVRKQILEESEIKTDNTNYFEGWDHAIGNALRIIDLAIKRLKDSKKTRTIAFNDYYNNDDPNVPYGEEKSYKKFEDLEFSEAPFGSIIRAGLEFNNGYGVSVVVESDCTMSGLHEVAILKDGSICYSSSITEDVFRYLTSDEVTEIMEKAQNL